MEKKGEKLVSPIQEDIGAISVHIAAKFYGWPAAKVNY